MASIAPITTPVTLTQAAVTQLREAIVTGQLAAGELLKEVELAQQLGLSVTPVREALLQLAAEGLITLSANRRKQVAPMDIKAMVDLLAVQNRLWALAYDWGAPKVGAQALQQLERTYQQHAAAIEAGDRSQAVIAAHRFHGIIMQASDNQELIRVSSDRLALIRRFILTYTPASASQTALNKHRQLLDALIAQDFKQVTAIHHEINTMLLALAKQLLVSETASTG